MLLIRGVVKAGREFARRMRNGIAPGERDSFLLAVKDALASVDELLRQKDASERDLPGPSRRAVAYIRQVARTPPHRLPTEPENHHFPKPIRIVSYSPNETHVQLVLVVE